MPWVEWYYSLAKPSWTPAPSTIGLTWQILYPIILVSFGFVFIQAMRRKVSWLVAVPFAINLVTNLIFTPIQFGMRNLPLAAGDILIVWATIIWMSVAIWQHYRWVAVAQVPYFIWVSLATMPQLGAAGGPATVPGGWVRSPLGQAHRVGGAGEAAEGNGKSMNVCDLKALVGRWAIGCHAALAGTVELNRSLKMAAGIDIALYPPRSA